MTKTAFQEIEGVIVNATDTELKISLDKVLYNETAEASSGQFVCTGANKIDLDGFNWQMSNTESNLSSELKDAYEASDIDTSSLLGYTFANNEGQQVTIWSDSEQDHISFNGNDMV